MRITELYLTNLKEKETDRERWLLCWAEANMVARISSIVFCQRERARERKPGRRCGPRAVLLLAWHNANSALGGHPKECPMKAS